MVATRTRLDWIEKTISHLKVWVDSNLEFFLPEALDRLSTYQQARSLTVPAPSIVLHVVRNENIHLTHVNLCVGYPFPIYTEKYSYVDSRCDGLEIFVHFHQAGVQEHLRNTFLASLEKIHKIRVTEVDINKFRDEVTKCLVPGYDLLLFNDPYHYVGDSVSSLRNFTAFSEYVHYQKALLITSNEPVDGYKGFEYYNLHDLASKLGQIPRDESVFALLPVYIDDQWELVRLISVNLLKNLANVVIAMPGCNLLICQNTSKKLTSIYHLAEKDVILWDFPNEEMIGQAVGKFICSKEKPSPRSSINGQKRIILNPFSSNRFKDLPLDLIQNLASQLRKRDMNVVLFAGFKSNPYHSEWIERFRTVPGAWVDDLYFLGPISEMAEKITQASLVITSDTSIAHIVERENIPSVVVYNSYFWDKASWGSLMHHSPLGFCNNLYCQIPLVCSPSVFRGQIDKSIITSMLGCVCYMLNLGSEHDDTLSGFIIQHGEILETYLAGSSNWSNDYVIEIVRFFQNYANIDLDEADQWLTKWLEIELLLPAIFSDETTSLQREKLLRKFIRISPLYKAYGLRKAS